MNKDWTKSGRILRRILAFFGLALEKDYSYADWMWVIALNHCCRYLTVKETPKAVKKNLVELLYMIDEDGKEFINEWINDYNAMINWTNMKSNKFSPSYCEFLKEVCPMFIKEKEKNDEYIRKNL